VFGYSYRTMFGTLLVRTRRTIVAAAAPILLAVLVLAPASAQADPLVAAVAPPAAITGSTATLQGELGPDVPQYQFLYHAPGVYTWTETAKTTASGAGPITAAISGLNPGTVYSVKVRAILPGRGGYAYSPITTFKTAPPAPQLADITFAPITELTATGATFDASTTTPGSTTAKLEWGTTPGAYPKSVAFYATVDGATRRFHRELPSSFVAGVTYYVRVTVTNASGSTSTAARPFTPTPPPGPDVTVNAVDPISATLATINTTVLPRGSAVTASTVEWGTTTSYGKSLPLLAGATVPGGRIYSRPLQSLKALTTYHYRVTVTTTGGTYVSPDRTFTTTNNRKPTATADAFSVVAGSQHSGNVVSNDIDPDNDPLTATLLTQPAHGTVTLQPNGAFTYTPTVGYSGPDSFGYWITDGHGETSSTTVTITVTPTG